MDCHDTETSEGGLNLQTLDREITDENLDHWRRVFDQLDRVGILLKIKAAISRRTIRSRGNIVKFIGSVGRKSKSELFCAAQSVEYRRTIGDLLGLDVSLGSAATFPDETDHGLDNVGETLMTSDFSSAPTISVSDKRWIVPFNSVRARLHNI